nr:squamosa promoter-binding-like protein 14 [Ipomoea batatas]
MEELSAGVVSPMLIHHQQLGGYLPHSMAKKRSLPFQPINMSQQRNPLDTWNPKAWEWDSTRFLAKRKDYDGFQPGAGAELQPKRREEQMDDPKKTIHVVEDDETLRLNLGGTGGCKLNAAEELALQPNKRVRSGSPNGGNYPMCQVDNCRENLTNAKDYHRRHKVCEIHSKVSKALVRDQMQRFCQQCSRFHLLLEFDEGKRSCRRRLAGHNKRRRKTQPDDTTSRPLLPGNNDNSGNRNLDIVNLLAVLASEKGNNDPRSANIPLVPDKDQIMEILSKIKSLPLPANLVDKLPASGSSSQTSANQLPPGFKANESISSPSTLDLLSPLSATPAAGSSDAVDIQSQRSSQGSDTERSTLTCVEKVKWLNLQERPPLELLSVQGDRTSASYQSTDDLDFQVHETRSHLPLQLFSSQTEDDSPPRLAGCGKYFSSESSNPSAERSPSSSPHVEHKLFPMQISSETVKPDCTFASMEETQENKNLNATKKSGCITSLKLFGGSITGADICSIQNPAYRTGYTSSYGSDHSPSSTNSDARDRTGRIIFKLFDKDPSHLPGTLRTQIYNWLSKSPSDMESYIRPGCIVLSLYLSMPPSVWEQLEEDLFQYANALVKEVDPQFWASGRFLIRTDKQLALHKDGNIRVCKLWREWKSPELIYVSPLAIISGQEIYLTLKGRNLNFPGTKINCTHAGGYTIRSVPSSACQENACEEIILGNFVIDDKDPSLLGRCFIEVENGFGGSTFPVIIADNAVCEELRCLESEIIEIVKVPKAVLEHGNQDFWMPRSREEVVHFLNELGWLFQRKGNSSMFEGPDFMISRFKFLFMFSVEHDFCAVVKTLLDILLEITLVREASRESLEMLFELQLLSRAVKRKCRKMVDLLVHYSICASGGSSIKYIFTPNLTGPGGITPLHLAACTSNSDDIVDALTSDPQEIGLHCWESVLDENGLSPCAYASMRNNHSYNKLVSQKLSVRENCKEICLVIGNEVEEQEHKPPPPAAAAAASQVNKEPKSCSKCASAAIMRYNRPRGPRGLMYRPYIHSLLAIAAVCACVCIFFRGSPDIGSVAPLKWENLDFGAI